jgi:hypothetical protein
VMALVVAGLVVLGELGMSLLLGSDGQTVNPQSVRGLGVSPGQFAQAHLASSSSPGSGIGYLAFLDGLVFFTVLMLGLSLIIQLRVYGRTQGVVTLIVSIVWLIVGFIAALIALAKLLLMVGLLIAVPFGTIAYLALWGFFPTGKAATVLALLLFLKIVFAVLLVLAQPRFLRIKGLVILVLLSLVVQLVLGIIQSFLPGPIVSIGDELWALVTAIVAIIWAIIMLIGSIPAIVKAVHVSGSLADAA